MKIATLALVSLCLVPLGCGVQSQTMANMPAAAATQAAASQTWSIAQHRELELSGSSGSVSFNSNVGAHDLIVVCVMAILTNANPIVTDNAGDTFLLARSELQQPSNLYIFYAQNAIGGSTAVNISTDAPGNNIDVLMTEIAGGAQTNILDNTGGAEISGGATFIGGGISTSTKADDLIFGVAFSGSQNTPSGTQIGSLQSFIGYLSTQYTVASRLSTPDNQLTLSWSQIDPSKHWVGLISAFKSQ